MANAKNPDIPNNIKEVQASAAYDQLAKGIRNLSQVEYVYLESICLKTVALKVLHTYTECEFESYIKSRL